MPSFQDIAVTFTIAALFWEVFAFIFAMVVLYFVVKAAVRNGIDESRLGSRSWTTPPAKRTTRGGDTLPPMHAD